MATIRGNAKKNILTGTLASDRIFGLGGNDTLTGLKGNDTLDGGTGRDTMKGGKGDDIYIVDNILDTAIEAANQGIDTVKSKVTFTLGANVEKLTLTGVGLINGTGNALANVLTGNDSNNTLDGGAGADTLIGGAGADVLDGGTGADQLIGGDGNDTYFVDDAGDIVTELFNEGGSDEVKTSLNSYTLAADVEVLNFNGVGNFTGTGNGLNNGIGGGVGDDFLLGGAGTDRIYGSLGQDTLNGGGDDDTFLFVSVDDSVPLLSDIIADFTLADGDKIDLSLIDANQNVGAPGDQSFFFLAGQGTAFTGGFHSPQGEVRFYYDALNDWTIVEVNLDDGGTTADMAIRLVGNINLVATDFNL